MLGIAAAAVLVAAAYIVFFSKTGYVLQLRDDTTGKMVFSGHIAEDGIFSVSYLHSVNKSEVEEYYRCSDNQILLDSVRYATFGAGMATEVEPPQTLEMIDGVMWIKNFDRPIGRLSYNVGVVCNNTLHFNGADIRLDKLAKPRSSVTFSLKKP